MDASGNDSDVAADSSTVHLIQPNTSSVDGGDVNMPSTSNKPQEYVPLSERPGTSGDVVNTALAASGDVKASSLGSVTVVRDEMEVVVDRRSYWRGLQLLVYACAFLCCVTAFAPALQVDHALNGKCLLFAHIEVGVNDTVTVTEWGDSTKCNFATYPFVAASAYAFVCCWFFLVCGTSRTALVSGDKPSQLVLPALVVSVVVASILFATSLLITLGLDEVCQQASSCHRLVTAISQVENVAGDHSSPHPDTYDQLVVMEVAAWVATTTWILAALTLLLRLLSAADFPKAKEDKDVAAA